MPEPKEGSGPSLGAIPQSKALEEARPESLGELFSRDPEGLSEIDLGRLVTELRADRERRAKAVAAGGSKPKAVKAPKPTTVTTKSIADLGL